jgi:Tfp pilus assembly protein PilO
MLIGKNPVDKELLGNCLKQIDSNLSFDITTEKSDPSSEFLNELTYKISISNTNAKISSLMSGVESLGYQVSLLHTTRKLCGS